jgi:hypothetical protein
VRETAFSWYLAGVGLVAATAYIVGRPVEFATARYVLLALLVPTGLVGALFALEHDYRWRAGVLTALAMWASLSLVASARLQILYATDPPRNQMRELADALTARGVTVAQAPYWRAYRIAFLTGERIKVASGDVVRIEEYQRLAAQEGPRLLLIQEGPCPGGETVAIWYLCRAEPR